MSRHVVHGGVAGAGTRMALAGSLLVVATASLWSGCSVEKNYELLSFFFDGVPNPAAVVGPGQRGVPVDIRQSPTYTIHRPFAEEACAECHKGRTRPSVQDSGMCLKCHEAKITEYPRMHGPVAAVACLWCHAPHESAYAALLKAPANGVCAQCHELALLSDARVPEHKDQAKDCLQCHFGHGGTERYFLRVGVAVQTRAGGPAGPLQK